MNDTFATIEQAVADLRAGKMIILVDDENRENEGDLVIAADKITPEAINFMSMHARGLICLSMSGELIDKLNLPSMAQTNRSRFGTAFTVSIEATSGVTTGISAADRAHTIKTAINKDAKPQDIISPGHVFPLRARKDGVLVRQGQTEGSVDLTILAGLTPAAVICEIIKDDGSMARIADLSKFSQQHNIKIVTINDLIAYRLANETIVKEIASSQLPIDDLGEFTVKIFGHLMADDQQPMVLIKPPVDPDKPCLVRVHSECFTGDVLGSVRCDCGWQLKESLAQIAEQGGILIYMRQEGRGIGLVNKIKAYSLQDNGMDTVEANHHLGFPADKREYGIAAQILRYLGVKKLNLLTNNPRKIYGLGGYGIEIVERIPLVMKPHKDNKQYLITKQQKLGHWLGIGNIGNITDLTPEFQGEVDNVG